MKRQFEERPNTGVLFVNDRKQSDKAPDFSGTLTIGEDLADLIRKSPGSTQFRLAGWKRATSTGSTMLSIAVSNIQGTYSKKRTENNDDTPW